METLITGGCGDDGDIYNHGDLGLILVSEEAMVMNIMLNVPLMFEAHTKYTSSVTFQRAF